MRRPKLRLRRDLRAAIGRGHPWIYDRARPSPVDVAPGDLVTARRRARPVRHRASPIRRGPIRARVLDLDPAAAIDDAWARAAARARRAAHRRCPLARRLPTRCASSTARTTACPASSIDVYAGAAVIVFDGGAAAAVFWRRACRGARRPRRAGGVAVRARVDARRARRARRGARRCAASLPALVAIHEDAARFDVDVRHGQKTGFFLDQRDNRRASRRHAAGARVLNLFAYTGGFSMHAGARRRRPRDQRRSRAPRRSPRPTSTGAPNGLPADRTSGIAERCVRRSSQRARRPPAAAGTS